MICSSKMTQLLISVLLLFTGLQIMSPQRCTDHHHREWSRASSTELQEAYFSHELCAINGGHCDSRRSRNSLSLLRQCHVGFVRKNIWAGREQEQKKTCRSRGFENRSSLLFSWKKAVDGCSDHVKEHTYGLVRGMFNSRLAEEASHGGAADGTTTAAPITQNIVLLGDSVSSQLAQFLVCDLLHEQSRASSRAQDVPSSITPRVTRSHTSAGHQSPGDTRGGGQAERVDQDQDKVVKSFNWTVANFWVPLSTHQSVDSNTTAEGSALLRIHNQQFNLPCLQNNRSGKCSFPKEQAVFDHVTNLLSPFIALQPPPLTPAASRTHTMIIFNYGLHIHRKYSWTMKPMLAALLRRASALSRHNISFYFRETSSQSFTGSPGGYFKYDMADPSPDAFCCSEPLSAPLHDLEWRNRLALEELDALDPLWRHHVHWLPFFNTSAALSDLRAEWNAQTALPDCTHFVYSPLAFHSLWHSIHMALAG